jgi:O-antigen/teichoic acid export membrane protein
MSITKSLSIYTVLSGYQALLAFLTLSFFSFHMSTNEFGAYNLYLSILPFLLNFMTMGVTGAIARAFHRYSALRFKLYISQVVFFLLPVSLLVGITFYIAFEATYGIFDLDRYIILLLVLITFQQIAQQVVLTIYQTSQRAMTYAKFNFLILTSNFLLSITVYFLYKDLYILFSTLVVLNLLLFSLSIFLLLKQKLLIFKFSKRVFFSILNFGLPLVIHTAGITILFMSDRFFISYFIGNEEVARYSVAVQLTLIVLIIVNSFSSAWGAHLFAYLEANNLKVKSDLFKKILFFCFFFMIFPLVIYYPQTLLLDIFFDESYMSAVEFIFVLSFGYALMGIWKVFVGFLHYSKQTLSISILTMATLVLNSILNYFFIQSIGAIGVAWATLFSMGFLSLMTILLSYKSKIIIWSIRT